MRGRILWNPHTHHHTYNGIDTKIVSCQTMWVEMEKQTALCRGWKRIYLRGRTP